MILYGESSDIAVQIIFQSGGSLAKCIKDTAVHFGISIIVVKNYKDTIREIKKQTRYDFCDYYVVLVILSLFSSDP